MERVNFTFKNGHVRIMGRRQAELLGKIGHGSYMTRDMVAVRDASPPQIPEVAAETDSPDIDQPVEVEDLDSMDAEQLHVLAKRRGVDVHHRAGADKVRAALRESAQ